MEEEVLDVQPLNEIIPENIRFQQDGNPINIGPTSELTAIEQKKIYNWVMKSLKEDGVQQEMIATFQGCRNLFLLRMEFRLLKPRKWINSSGEYFGMNPNLDIDKENFDREKTATRQWWLIPICHRRHWYLYAFNLVKRELLVLDSLFDHPFDDKRKIVDLYVIVEDMLKIVFSTYHHTEIRFQCSFAKVPKQPNNDDCGICMLKFMESWTEDSNLKEFNNEQLNEIRRRLVIEIATIAHQNRTLQFGPIKLSPGQTPRRRQVHNKSSY
ncbi:hypothetical protein PIB30_073360 [Stylosanthes scabra]|uniref:Ubiquitin-like protease family profile domain-containing protein n=1 Tax=Stylosanthes scabra TaxID=79078 RepID=A0ABU6URL7_9FABA|nr:hypothetical protein [Stylosanthes scabra]